MHVLMSHVASDPSSGRSNAVVAMASHSTFAPPKLADYILTERLGSGTYATDVGIWWR